MNDQFIYILEALQELIANVSSNSGTHLFRYAT